MDHSILAMRIPFEQLWELYQASTGEMLEIEKMGPAER